MALSDVNPLPEQHPGIDQESLNYPCAMVSNWTPLVTDPLTADSSPSHRYPDGIIAGSSGKHTWPVGNRGTSMLLMLAYPTGLGSLTSPKVCPYGKDANGVFHPLQDVSGNRTLTITADVTNDPTSTINGNEMQVTKPIGFDMDCSGSIVVAMHTAFAAGSGTPTGAMILGKLKN